MYICYKYRFCLFLCFFLLELWNCYDNWIIFVFHFISTIFLLDFGNVFTVWYFCVFFPIFIINLRSVLENTMWYNGILGQRIDVGILDVVTVKSAVDCARRCHQHINCNNFNFRRINMKCELVGARKRDSKTNINYDVYSQC